MTEHEHILERSIWQWILLRDVNAKKWGRETFGQDNGGVGTPSPSGWKIDSEQFLVNKQND
jgi:hypothetical protein